MDPPIVTIGLPMYNCATTLDRAIRSILNQTFCDWELLLVDDGSTDKTVDLARAYSDARVRIYTDGRHAGLVARLNQATDLGRGKYFARMDGDDISYPERLALQVKYLEAHDEIDLLGGGMLIFGRGGGVLGVRECGITHEEICRRPWAGFYLAHPTWIGKIEWFRKHRYRAEAVRCEDQDLLLRTYENSRFAALSEIVLGYREEELSLTKILSGRRNFARSVVRKAFQRGSYLRGVGAVVEQILKGLTDCVAVGTGLGYCILRHRALPADSTAKRRWMEVWEAEREHESSSPYLAGNV